MWAGTALAAVLAAVACTQVVFSLPLVWPLATLALSFGVLAATFHRLSAFFGLLALGCVVMLLQIMTTGTVTLWGLLPFLVAGGAFILAPLVTEETPAARKVTLATVTASFSVTWFLFVMGAPGDILLIPIAVLALALLLATHMWHRADDEDSNDALVFLVMLTIVMHLVHLVFVFGPARPYDPSTLAAPLAFYYVFVVIYIMASLAAAKRRDDDYDLFRDKDGGTERLTQMKSFPMEFTT